MTTRSNCHGITRLLVLTTFAIAVAPARAQTSNWPQWRGPAGAGISTEVGLPSEWSDTKNISWKTPIPGRGHSSPIVWNNRIFLTSSIEGPVVPGAEAVRHIRKGQEYLHPDSVGADHSYTLKLICLDATTGKVLWEKPVYEGRVYDNRHRKNTYASTTPATDGKYVYVSFEAEGLYCYDFDGKLAWKTSLGKIAKGGMGPGTSPVLYENLVILQCDQEYGETSFIAAVDRKTGKEVWRVPRIHRRSWATPLLVKTPLRTELVTSGAESVISYDPADARLQSQVIYTDSLTFVVSSKHRLAQRKTVSITELGEENFIAHNVISPYREVVVREFQKHQVPLRMDVEMPTVETIRKLVQDNLGVAFLPRMCVEEEIAQGRLCEVRVKEMHVERKIRLVYPKRRALSHAAQAFLKVVG